MWHEHYFCRQKDLPRRACRSCRFFCGVFGDSAKRSAAAGCAGCAGCASRAHCTGDAARFRRSRFACSAAARPVLPPVPYCRPSAQKPTPKTPLAAPPPRVAALYQYNYDNATGAGFRYDNGADALTQHPAQPKNYSYKSAAWHKRELSAMREAGIDVALCNYWGNPADRASPPGQGLRWSFDGLRPLADAAAQINQTKHPAPKIGLYFSVGSFADNAAHFSPDLATNDGRAWLYVSLRDFFSLVPPRLRATGANNGPLVFVSYDATLVKNGAGSAALWQYIRAHFVADFGVEPCLILQDGWRSGEVPSVGGVINGTFPQVTTPKEGLRETETVAALGPGIDLRANPQNEQTAIFRDREKGAFYEKQWRMLLSRRLASRPRLVFLQSWNEWQPATALAPSREYGDKYVLLTRKWADLFHRGFYAKPLPVPGPYRNADRVSWFAATAETKTTGLRLVVAPDGLFISNQTATGGAYAEADPSVGNPRHLYFDVNDSFVFDADDEQTKSAPLRLTFEYFDQGHDHIVVQYDATPNGEALRNGGDDSGYTLAAEVPFTNTGTWKTATVVLPHPRFANRQNYGADFRFQVSKNNTLRLRWVTLRRGDGAL